MDGVRSASKQVLKVKMPPAGGLIILKSKVDAL